MLFTIAIMIGGGISLPLLYKKRKKERTVHKKSLKFKSKLSSEEEWRLNRDLNISILSTVLTSGGYLFYPPLVLLSLPGLFWVNMVTARDTYFAYKAGRGLGIDALAIFVNFAFLATGHYFASALGGAFSRFSKKLLAKTEDRSKQNLISVFDNKVQFVWLFTEGVELEIPISQLKQGDIIVVHAGEMIAADGIVDSGLGVVDQRMLTGESQPVEKTSGDSVFASTVVLSGNLKISVEKTGEQTVADQIAEVLNRTTDFKQQILSQGEKLSDRSARFNMGLGLLTLPFLGVTTAITVSTACFGFYYRALAPISMLSFLSLSLNKGLLIKDGRSLQLLNQVDTVVFDKTGTLTLDKPHVNNIYTIDGIDEEDLLAYAAAIEHKQTHPIALAIKEKSQNRGFASLKIEDVHYEMGHGVAARIEGQLAQLGSRRFMEAFDIHIPEEFIQLELEHYALGHSLVYLAVDKKIWGMIELQATVRPEARMVIEQLKQRNIETYIISGDHEAPTKQLAAELGIKKYFSEVLPEDKARLVDKLQKEGKSVCFVGDGINDAIALKKATVSVSLHGASTVATDAAQIVLMNQNLKQLIQGFDIAHDFKNNMKHNLIATIVPSIITLYGAFFLHFGVLSAVILNDIGFVAGVSNAMFPRKRNRRQLP